MFLVPTTKMCKPAEKNVQGDREKCARAPEKMCKGTGKNVQGHGKCLSPLKTCAWSGCATMSEQTELPEWETSKKRTK